MSCYCNIERLTMNENLRKWIVALRSKKYKKGLNGLKTRNSKDELVYCPLGIACDIFHNETGLGEWQPREGDSSFYIFYCGSKDFSGIKLPEAVRKWLGLKSCLGDYKDNNNLQSCIAVKNDYGTSFETIAKIIESEPKGLLLKISKTKKKNETDRKIN